MKRKNKFHKIINTMFIIEGYNVICQKKKKIVDNINTQKTVNEIIRMQPHELTGHKESG